MRWEVDITIQTSVRRCHLLVFLARAGRQGGPSGEPVGEVASAHAYEGEERIARPFFLARVCEVGDGGGRKALSESERASERGCVCGNKVL